MSREKGLVDIVKISDHTVKELARKGWVHDEQAHTFSREQSSNYPSSQENEFSISCGSSPGCKSTMNRSATKIARCVVTRLDFTDCVVNKNKVSRASVKRVVKPLGTNDNENVISLGQNISNKHAVTEDIESFVRSNRTGPANDETLSIVPESPMAKSGYSFGDILNLNQCIGVQEDNFQTREEAQSASQEVKFTPPRLFNLQNCRSHKSDTLRFEEDSCLKYHETSVLKQSKNSTKLGQKYTVSSEQKSQQFTFVSGSNLIQNAETESTNLEKEAIPSANEFNCSLPDSLSDLIPLDFSSQTPKYNTSDGNKSPILGSKSRSGKRRKCRRKHPTHYKPPGEIQAVNLTTRMPGAETPIHTDDKENTLISEDSSLLKQNGIPLDAPADQRLHQDLNIPLKHETSLYTVDKSNEDLVSSAPNGSDSSPRVGVTRNGRKKGKRKLNLQNLRMSPKVLCSRDNTGRDDSSAVFKDTNDVIKICDNRDEEHHNISDAKSKELPMKEMNSVPAESGRVISHCSDVCMKPNNLSCEELHTRKFSSISVEHNCTDKADSRNLGGKDERNYVLSLDVTLKCNSVSPGQGDEKLAYIPNKHKQSGECSTHSTGSGEAFNRLQSVANISCHFPNKSDRLDLGSNNFISVASGNECADGAISHDGAHEGKLSMKIASEQLCAVANDDVSAVAEAKDTFQSASEEEASSSLVIENASSGEERELAQKETKSVLCSLPVISQLSSPGAKSEDPELHITPSSEPHTPTRHEFPPQGPAPDSGKKKKRLKKGGLAARLQRLLARRQAAMQLCRYEQAAGLRVRGGVVLSAQKVWLEHGRLLIECSRAQGGDGKGPPGNWLLVLEPRQLPNLVPPVQLAHCPVLRVEPPWQSLCLPRLGLMLLLGLSHVEFLPAASGLPLAPAVPAPLVELHTEIFRCPCLDRTSAEAACTHQLPSHGSVLMQLLFPVLSGTAAGSCDGQLQAVAPVPCAANTAGTVAAAVARHTQGLPGSHCLSLRLLRICCCRPPRGALEADHEPPSVYRLVWSVLGQDSAGECCEVVLGTPHEGQLTREWLALTTGTALNSQLQFSGLALARRMTWEMVPGLCDLLVDPTSGRERRPSQMFFYLFSAVPETWSMLQLDPSLQLSPLLQTETLLEIQSRGTQQPSRHTALALVLAHTTNALYLADGSLRRGSARLALQPCAQVPGCVLGRVVCVCDMLQLSGELVADKYCRLLVANASDMPPAFRRSIEPSAIVALYSLSPVIPRLESDSQPGDLVTVTGQVQGVDEASALQWPVCVQCGRDLQEQQRHQQLLCPHCGLTEPRTRLTLDVFLQGPGPNPEHCLRIKLGEDTIAALLPDLSEAGCDVASVLGRSLGPLLCLLQSTGAGHTTLQELPPWGSAPPASLPPHKAP